MRALAIYYALAGLFYLGSAGLLAMANGYASAWFADAFPVIFSKERKPVEICLRLLGVACLAFFLAWSLWVGWWVGCVAVLLVSAYEVYLSWTFYREQADETMQMARLTFNSVSAGYCFAWLLTWWGFAL